VPNKKNGRLFFWGGGAEKEEGRTGKEGARHGITESQMQKENENGLRVMKKWTQKEEKRSTDERKR
jgi:hypothetical protein